MYWWALRLFHTLTIVHNTVINSYGCSCSVTKSCPTLCDPIDYSTTGFSVLHFLPEFAQIHAHWVPMMLYTFCHPLLIFPSIFPSIRVFSNESALCIKWPKYWRFSFSISLSSGYSGLISFMINASDLLAVQGTLKSLLQHHSSKASVLQHSAFFIVKLSHLYMTTGKTIVWLYGPLLTNYCLCFLMHCLDLS